MSHWLLLKKAGQKGFPMAERIMKHATNETWMSQDYFLKPNKELVKEKKSFRGGEQSKKRMAITVFVAADVSKPCDPVVVLRRQLLR